MDVITPIILVPNTTIADILVKAGQNAHYKFTPLDFVSRNDSSWQLYWTYWMDLVRKMGIDFVPKQRPTTHIADDNFPALSPRTMFVLFLFQSTYAGIHIGGWNFDFPSRIEHVLWRVSTIYILGSIVFYWLFDLYAWHLHVRVKHYFISGSAPAKTRDPEENDVANCCNDSGQGVDTYNSFGGRLPACSSVCLNRRFCEPALAATKCLRFNQPARILAAFIVTVVSSSRREGGLSGVSSYRGAKDLDKAEKG